MKTKLFIFALFASFFTNGIFAQDRTTVTATTNDISDNLDLRAVASVFGDSENLEDFERRLNDPKKQISNLDLNGDDKVDYLRVIESVEGNTHLIIIQSVLEKDVYQDVATVEVEKDSHNQVQVQVVGDVYMYGDNYIYEPVYVYQPVIYDYFWVNNYHPYYSSWYYGYYPTYYYAWNPYPVYHYRNNMNICIHDYNHYNYVNIRRSHRAVALLGNTRANGYELRNPNRSFHQRNENVTNRYELDQVRHSNGTNTGLYSSNVRNNANGSTRSNSSNTRNNGLRNAVSPGHTRTPNSGAASQNSSATPSVNSNTGNIRSHSINTRAEVSGNTAPSENAVQSNIPRAETPTVNTRANIITTHATTTPRNETPVIESVRTENTRSNTTITTSSSTSPTTINTRNESPVSNTRSESPAPYIRTESTSTSPQQQSETRNSARNENRTTSQGASQQRSGGRR